MTLYCLQWLHHKFRNDYTVIDGGDPHLLHKASSYGEWRNIRETNPACDARSPMGGIAEKVAGNRAGRDAGNEGGKTMADQHDFQQFVDETHAWAENLLKRGACPSCLAQAMISEGFHLAGEAGVLPLAKEIADRYANGDGGPVLSTH